MVLDRCKLVLVQRGQSVLMHLGWYTSVSYSCICSDKSEIKSEILYISWKHQIIRYTNAMFKTVWRSPQFRQKSQQILKYYIRKHLYVRQYWKGYIVLEGLKSTWRIRQRWQLITTNNDVTKLFENCDVALFKSSINVNHCLRHLYPEKRQHVHSMTFFAERECCRIQEHV